MYKLIIADDEPIIRDGLTKIVDWNELEFEVAEVLSDGQEVIECLEYINADVILTDIKMTAMSGIDVARYVYDNALDCMVVFISAYKEFDLALSGMKYGVNDFLVKPTNASQITEIFKKVRVALDKRDKDIRHEQIEKERFIESLIVLKSKFLCDLFLGVIDNEDYITKKMTLLYPNVHLTDSYCVLLEINIQDFELYFQNIWQYSYDQFEYTVANFINVYDGQMTFSIVYKSHDTMEVFGIVVVNQGQLPISYEKECYDEVSRLIYELSFNLKVSIKYEIKKIFTNIFEVLKQRDEILTNLTYNHNSIHLQEQKKLMMSNISLGNIGAAQKIFNSILEEMINLNPYVRNNFIIDIFCTINEIFKNVNLELANNLQIYINYSALASLETFDDAKDYCNRLFDRIRMKCSKIKQFDTGSLINKAKQYIQNNIFTDISQEETANQLYICSSYLSRIFKKETGENFSQYVTRIKIEKALELLRDPQYKSYQVGEYLGYKTPGYFARIFKSQTGLNPSEYRSQILHIGGDGD